jgi:hypothetical protein
MAEYKINYEVKNRRLTRPLLNEIVGSHILNGGDELIIRCISATKPARDAVNKYYEDRRIKITIVDRDPHPYNE